MKRSPLKRYSSLKQGGAQMKRTRLSPRSEQKVSDNAKYVVAKAEYQAEHPNCEFTGCTRSLRKGNLVDLHHRAGRNGPLLYTKKYFSTLCREHHDYVEEHLSWSRANGWIIDVSSEEVRQLRLAEL